MCVAYPTEPTKCYIRLSCSYVRTFSCYLSLSLSKSQVKLFFGVLFLSLSISCNETNFFCRSYVQCAFMYLWVLYKCLCAFYNICCTVRPFVRFFIILYSSFEIFLFTHTSLSMRSVNHVVNVYEFKKASKPKHWTNEFLWLLPFTESSLHRVSFFSLNKNLTWVCVYVCGCMAAVYRVHAYVAVWHFWANVVTFFYGFFFFFSSLLFSLLLLLVEKFFPFEVNSTSLYVCVSMTQALCPCRWIDDVCMCMSFICANIHFFFFSHLLLLAFFLFIGSNLVAINFYFIRYIWA